MPKTHTVPWQEHLLKDKQEKQVTIADSHFSISYSNKEIHIAHVYQPQQHIADASIKRWPVENEQPVLKVEPALPDRPLVVKTESTLNIAVNSHNTVFMRFPVSLKIILIDGKAKTDLMELPAVKLSNTWFGTFFDGELCYGLTSSVRNQIEPDPKRNYMAICPLKLLNNGEEALNIDKLCVRPDYLSLFMDNGQLWTDEMKITFRGNNEASQINASGKAPKLTQKAQLITRARITNKKSLYARSFSSIKDLYDMTFR